jgi:uncharacterized protein Yka (UPF0111/DUF47 family)
MRRARIVVAVALVLIPACSGGSAKEEFIEQADRLCREADEKTRDVEVPRTPEGLRNFVEQAREISGELVRGLRELEVPEGDRDRVEAMLSRIEEAIDLLPELSEAARTKNAERLAELGRRLQQVSSEANRIAQDYGLQDCGRSDPAPVP